MQLRKVIFELDLKNLNENLPDCEGKNAHARERDPQALGHRVMEDCLVFSENSWYICACALEIGE